MQYGACSAPAPLRAALDFKRQAFASILAICAVTLMAASYAGLHAGQHRGGVVDLMEVVPINVPYADSSMLAQMPQQWNDEQLKPTMQQLSEEKTVVGNKLANDMRKLWAAKTNGAKKQDKAKVETLRRRFESLVNAMDKSPVMRVFRGPNGELRAIANGQVYQLYDYHVPGGYEDVPLDLDTAVPIFEKNPAGSPGNFKDPTGRNPIYQGVYPAYASRQAPMLYGNQPEYLAPSEQQAQPNVFVVSDAAGQLRLVSPADVQGMRNSALTAETPEQAEWATKQGELMQRMRAEVMQAREARLARAEEEQAPSTEQLATVPRRMSPVVRQAWNSQSLTFQRPAAASATTAQQPAAKSHKAAPRRWRKAARKDPMLTDSGIHSYGTVYEPYLDQRLNPAVGDEITNLRGAAKGVYDHYTRQATRYLNVRDPASDSAAGADWWTGPEAKENWWQHDHDGRGY